MKSLPQIVAETPSDAVALAAFLAQSPEPRQSSAATYVTYVLIAESPSLFGGDAGNLSGRMRAGLVKWIAADDLSSLNPTLPNPGYLESVHDRLKGATGLDLTSAKTPMMLQIFASGVDETHPPIMDAAQARAMLSIGYIVPDATLDDVAAVRLSIAKDDRLAKYDVAATVAADAYRAAVDAATSIDALPPEVTSNG